MSCKIGNPSMESLDNSIACNAIDKEEQLPLGPIARQFHIVHMAPTLP
jgi:hypothetical protein